MNASTRGKAIMMASLTTLMLIVVFAAGSPIENAGTKSSSTSAGISADPPNLQSLTPQVVTPTPEPTLAALASPVAIIPGSVSTVTVAATSTLSPVRAIDLPESIAAVAWAPTGGELVYVTAGGELYWAGLDGTNRILLHAGSHYYLPWFTQGPLSDTLLLPHLTPGKTGDHVDVLRFVLGRVPILTEAGGAGAVFELHWWSPDRASGIKIDTHPGGEKLVTLDASGGVVEVRNIPYLLSGAVQPGGEWLAYVTSQQTTDRPLVGSEPETLYFLNLNTGERLQVSRPGQGYRVYGWSPDGTRVLVDVCGLEACGGVTIGADGGDWITVWENSIGALGDAVWSPDGNHLAFSIQLGGCDHAGPCPPLSSEAYVIDFSTQGNVRYSAGEMMGPSWSPDGSKLAFSSFDPECPEPRSCSRLAPAVYLLTVK